MRNYQVSWDMVVPWIKSEGLVLRKVDIEQFREFTSAIAELDYDLGDSPLSIGEAKFKYKQLEMIRCIAFRGPLTIHYGVNPKKKIVIVSGMMWR